MAKSKTTSIREFWTNQPVGNNFIPYEKNKSFYEKYDAFRYRTEGHILWELDQIDFKEKRVLEIGVGQGSDSMQIIKRGALFYGLDLTRESVRRVKERMSFFGNEYEEIKEGNAEKLGYQDASFDLVYSHGVIHHSENIEKIIEQIHRVLIPRGQAIVMLYHKNSLNYHWSITVLRRVGLILLYIFPFLTPLASKITGEPIYRIKKHLMAFKKQGLSYLKMETFIHKSTDGPDNVFSSVWTKKEARELFKNFSEIDTNVHFLNERHLMGLQYLLPKFIKNAIARRFGWHLWIKAKK